MKFFFISAWECCFGWTHSSSSLYSCKCRGVYLSLCVIMMMMMKTTTPQHWVPPWKSLHGLRQPTEHAAVISRVLQDLCIVGNSISHNITLPAQCVPCRATMRPDSVQGGTRLSAASSEPNAGVSTSTACPAPSHRCRSLLCQLSAAHNKKRQLRAISLLNLSFNIKLHLQIAARSFWVDITFSTDIPSIWQSCRNWKHTTDILLFFRVWSTFVIHSPPLLT